MSWLRRHLTWHELRALATGATASVGIVVAVQGLLRLVSSMTLTRLLDARVYGVVGVMTSVAFMLTMLTDTGLHHFIINHEEGDESDFLDQVWTIRALRGVMLTIGMVVFARPIALFLHKPDLATVIAVWGGSFLLESLSSLSFATAIRRGELWRLSLLDLIGSGAAFALSLGLAVLLRSYWAIVSGMLGGILIKSIASYRLFDASRRRIVISRSRARELWRFSRPIALSSALSLVILEADKLLLARMMPLASYGLYAIAVTLTMSVGFMAGPYTERVLAGTYARTAREDRASLRTTFYAARRRITILQMVNVGGMIGAAPLIMAVLYDARYAGVAPFFQLLAISAALRLPVAAANQALLALGDSAATLRTTILRLLWLVAGGMLCLASGKAMLLVVMVGTIELPALLWLWCCLRRERLLRLREELAGLAVLAASALAGHFVARITSVLLPGL